MWEWFFFFFSERYNAANKDRKSFEEEKDDHLRKTKKMNDAKIYLVINNMALHNYHPSTWELEAGGPGGQDVP